MPNCPRCDTELPASARFCVQCGAAVADVADDAEADAPAAATDDEVTDLSMPAGADDTRVVGVELRSCPRCGASNAARRSQCGRCGAGLDAGAATGRSARHDQRDTPPTGQPVARPAPTPPPSQAASDTVGSGSRARDPRRVRRRRAIGAAFVGGGLLVGAAIGVAAGSGIGPFASPVTVDFDAASYGDDPSSVRPASTGATSTHSSIEGAAFGPTLAVDGDRTTGWAPQPDDRDTRLVHRFGQPVWIDSIEVASGLPDDVPGSALGRVTAATIDLRTLRVDASIADGTGMQVIQLQEPVLVEEVTWKVTGTAGGPGALAEVRYRGWLADQADRDALQGD